MVRVEKITRIKSLRKRSKKDTIVRDKLLPWLIFGPYMVKLYVSLINLCSDQRKTLAEERPLSSETETLFFSLNCHLISVDRTQSEGCKINPNRVEVLNVRLVILFITASYCRWFYSEGEVVESGPCRRLYMFQRK